MQAGEKIGEHLRRDVIEAWSEAEEITANFNGLSKEELIDSLDSIKKRAEKIRDLLGQYLDEEDLDEIAPL